MKELKCEKCSYLKKEPQYKYGYIYNCGHKQGSGFNGKLGYDNDLPEEAPDWCPLVSVTKILEAVDIIENLNEMHSNDVIKLVEDYKGEPIKESHKEIMKYTGLNNKDCFLIWMKGTELSDEQNEEL